MEKGLGCQWQQYLAFYGALRLAGSPLATTSHFELATNSNTKPNTTQDKSTGSQTAGDTVPVTQYESKSAVAHSALPTFHNDN
jgi:hypothetical protein